MWGEHALALANENQWFWFQLPRTQIGIEIDFTRKKNYYLQLIFVIKKCFL